MKTDPATETVYDALRGLHYLREIELHFGRLAELCVVRHAL
jgi:hypothetical protein